MGNTKHGDKKQGSNNKLYNKWYNLRARCKYECTDSYKDYGERGITVCPEWEDYIVFKEWALQNGYQEDLQIDRIDNNSGYSPENCRFVTPTVNSLNKRMPSTKQIGSYKGVRFYKPSQKWFSVVSINKKEKHLGYTDTEEEALQQRNDYIKEHNLETPIQTIKEDIPVGTGNNTSVLHI